MSRESGVELLLADAKVLDERPEMSLKDMCDLTGSSASALIELVDEGLFEPQGTTPPQWRFPATAITRVRLCQRLFSDLGVNMAGASVILELLDEVRTLRARVERVEFQRR
ncbi:MAG: chaperone modulator CbpM [Chromatiales bacterium]